MEVEAGKKEIDCEQSNMTNAVPEEGSEGDASINGFNVSHSLNVTVIEVPLKSSDEADLDSKPNSCEGSDSGVEVVDRPESNQSESHNVIYQDFEAVTLTQSCNSSVISSCSNYEEAIVQRDSPSFEPSKLVNVDSTSEVDSENSSVILPKLNNENAGAKKKVTLVNTKSKNPVPKCRNSVKPLSQGTPKNNISSTRTNRSAENIQAKNPVPLRTTPVTKQVNIKKTPNNLPLSASKKDVRKNLMLRANSASKTPVSTPDDGRWPLVQNKSASKAVRNIFSLEEMKKNQSLDLKTLEKYGTLPRRRRDRSVDLQKPLSRENSLSRPVVKRPEIKPLLNFRRKPVKTTIYHETSVQTAMTSSDIEKAFSGIAVKMTAPQDVEKCDGELQVDIKSQEHIELEKQHENLTRLHEELKKQLEERDKKLNDVEDQLKYEIAEKNSLRKELKQNTDRVLAILGKNNKNIEESSGDSLMVLENKFESASKVIITQEKEISELNEHCRRLEIELDKSLKLQNVLRQQLLDSEAESVELQEFMQDEKTTLTEALRDSDNEIKRLKQVLCEKEAEFEENKSKTENLRKENHSLQTKLYEMEVKCRELLVRQGGSMSGAAVALFSLISRLNGLVEELVASYDISDQELDDVIYHNEAYSNSSNTPDQSPDDEPSPTRGSFISAIINAIRNAAAQSPFYNGKDISRDNLCQDNSDSTEMLDSETEPCLMMEHVLEDVVIPDGHSHNMISSGHSMLSSRLTHSESLNNLFTQNKPEFNSCSLTASLNASYTSESWSDGCSSTSVVDQVINVDNLVTRLLKVIRIIQVESDDGMVQLQKRYERLVDDMDKERGANKQLMTKVKSLEEKISTLRNECDNYEEQMKKKAEEIEDYKFEINQQMEIKKKLNEVVCQYSDDLSSTQYQLNSEKAMTGALERTQEALHKEISELKGNLQEKEKQLNGITLEYQTTKNVLFENWKKTLLEAKKQYEAIDSALQTLHSIQSVVEQCPALAQVQRDLEETNFESASSTIVHIPPDFNANDALRQAMANLAIVSPINSTA